MFERRSAVATSRIRRSLVAFWLAFLGTAVPLLQAGSFNSAVETIQKRDLLHHCQFLASNALEGRETGTHGGEAAGAYIVDILRRDKRVAPAGAEGDYYQPFLPNSRNVLVRLAGSDKALAREFIVIGAHYDHVGYGNSRNSRGPIGFIHRGADDNASGTAALLELVDAFCSLDVAPKRSLLFVFWDGEEKGLLGSQYWISSPTVPLDRIRLVFNIDMIGRLRQNRAEVFGTRSAAGLRRFISSQNIESPFAMEFTWQTHRDSDHYSFFAERVPYLMIFTGKHAEYHTPYDDVDKLNLDGMQRITRLLFRAVYAAAQEPALPAFRPASFREGGQDQAEAEAPLPEPPARLGVTWDEARAKQKTILVTEVDAASAASAAGFQIGDRIVEFDGSRIGSADDLREAVLSAADPATALVTRVGQAAPRLLTVHLHGSPDPTGISCRVDDAEPGTAIVGRVASGSPAARAGIRVNDRIEKVARTTFGTLEEFRTLLAEQHAPFEIQIEREGELHILQVSPHASKRQGDRKFLPSSPH
jgi:C-terminal processing protease CtpA/Prc